MDNQPKVLIGRRGVSAIHGSFYHGIAHERHPGSIHSVCERLYSELEKRGVDRDEIVTEIEALPELFGPLGHVICLDDLNAGAAS